MKFFILPFLLIFSSCILFSQNTDTWIPFYNEDTTLVGYKDKYGKVKIEPKYSPFPPVGKFDHIVAVSEEENGKFKGFHLAKNGKKFGRDSIHVFDFSYDCENEGFIRFRDPKTELTGLFDRNGKVVIPAEYNELTRVKNGMIAGLKGAQKEYWEKEKHAGGCEHFSWTGGKQVLLDTANNLLVDNFEHERSLDFFSITKTKSQHPDKKRKSFAAENGNFYSFMNFEDEFRHWLTDSLLKDLTAEKLIRYSIDTITWESKNGWEKSEKRRFTANNFKAVKAGLAAISKPNSDYFISIEGLNQFMYEGSDFEKYYTNCGESKEWQYPVMNVVVNHGKGKKSIQNSYEFLRTEKGYRMINVVIRDKKLR